MGLLDGLAQRVQAEQSDTLVEPKTLGRLPAPTPPGAVKAAHPEWFGPDGKFKPGHKAPRSGIKDSDFAALVRDRTNDGELILEALLETLTGVAPLPVRDIDPETGEVRVRAQGGAPTAADRIAAAKLLSDRGWGRAPQTVEILGLPQSGDAAAFDISRLTPAQVRAYLEIRRCARGELPPGTLTVEGQAQPENEVKAQSVTVHEPEPEVEELDSEG